MKPLARSAMMPRTLSPPSRGARIETSKVGESEALKSVAPFTGGAD